MDAVRPAHRLIALLAQAPYVNEPTEWSRLDDADRVYLAAMRQRALAGESVGVLELDRLERIVRKAHGG